MMTRLPAVRFEATKGGKIEINLPESFGLQEPRKDQLQRVCIAISSEWLAREPPDKSIGRKVRTDDLARVCYQLITWCFEGDGLPNLLKERAKDNDYRDRKIIHRKDAFQVGLDAIFPRQKGGLTANQRKRLSAEMWFAFRHYIPDFLFTGFIHQSGGSTNISRMGLDHIMPDFREWVIERRADDGLLQFARGTYPPQIQRAVRERRRELSSSTRVQDIQRVIGLFAKMYDGRRRRFDRKGTFDLARQAFGRGPLNPIR